MKIDEIRYQLESIRSHELNASQAQALFYAQQELDQYQRLLERTRWIPVSERLPEFYQKVLIIDETKTLNITRLCHSSDWELYGITHWMPLPGAPEMTREEAGHWDGIAPEEVE